MRFSDNKCDDVSDSIVCIGSKFNELLYEFDVATAATNPEFKCDASSGTSWTPVSQYAEITVNECCHQYEYSN